MSFSTVIRVRAESGFTGNTDISDGYIQGYLTQANGVLLGYVASLYDARNFTGALFTNSQAETMLQRIEELFASGYLLITEYGLEAKNTDKDGYTKVKEATNLCLSMIAGTLNLFDVNSTEFPKKSIATAGVAILTTPTGNPDLTPIFSTTDRY